jgi:competence protein ComEC
VHVVDVGQGDSLLIRFPGGRTMLVDAGGWQGEFEKGRGAGEVVASYLRRSGVRKIDVLVLTHPHEDHAAGALFLLGRFAIGTVVVPPLVSPDQSHEVPDPAYYRLIDSMRRQHIPVRQVVCGDALSVDPKVKVDVLGPGAVPLSGTRSDLNNNSVVLSVRYGESSFLFTGDLELEGQARLLESGYALNHDVLKVPHHGSRYTSRDFLDSVNPGLAVISVGRNSFGQPHPDIMTLLEDGGRPVFRTDRDGLTVLFSDGRTIKTKIYKR